MRQNRMGVVTAFALLCLLLAVVTDAYGRAAGTDVPRWANVSLFGLYLSYGLLLVIGVRARRRRGEWWTPGVVAATTLVGVASLVVGHLLGAFSSGYAPSGLLKAGGTLLTGVALWNLFEAETASDLANRRPGAIALLALGAVTLTVAFGGQWLAFLWASGLGLWVAPLVILVGVLASRHAGGLRTASIVVATVGAVILLVLAPLLGENLTTLVACPGPAARWGSFRHSIDWSTLRVGWSNGCNGRSASPAVGPAGFGGALLAVGLVGERIAACWAWNATRGEKETVQ